MRVLALSVVAPLAVAFALAGCSTSDMVTTDAGANESSGDASPIASIPCDPLAELPTTLTAILGVGKDTDGTLYVADLVTAGSMPRVFVSGGTSLHRQHVLGAGSQGDGSGLDYTLSIEAPYSDGSDARALLLDVTGGAATAMSLGPADSKSFLGAPGQTPLTLVGASAIAGMAVIDLPGQPAYVLDGANGDAIVITAPGDNQSSDDFRLFYGTPGAMFEHAILTFEQTLSGGPDITFLVGTVSYELRIGVVYPPDASLLGEPGPATLIGDGAPQSFTMRVPTPATLPGFSFSCLGG